MFHGNLNLLVEQNLEFKNAHVHGNEEYEIQEADMVMKVTKAVAKVIEDAKGRLKDVDHI
jgi:hypothetical protein